MSGGLLTLTWLTLESSPEYPQSTLVQSGLLWTEFGRFFLQVSRRSAHSQPGLLLCLRR